MTTAAALIARARTTLIDANAVTWTDDELLGYLQTGIDKACGLLLDLNVEVVQHALDAGVRQTLPPRGLVLVDITLNSNFAPVLQAALTELSRVRPTWASDPPGPTAYFIYDQRAPRTFMVSPPAQAGDTVELLMGATPEPLADINDSVALSVWFDSALWAWVCAMALAKNTTRQDLTKSAQFMAMFTADMDRWQAAKKATASPPDLQGVH